MASKTTKQPRLTLHQLIIARSYWGSTTRLLLVGFLVAVIFAMKMLYLDTSLEWETKVAIYIFGSFALLDIGYVMLARALPLRRKFDAVALILVEAFLVVTYVLPSLVNAPSLGRIADWTFLIVLFALAIRSLLGLLFSTKKR